ncbi:MAG TPA: hypothetical protein VE465_29475 [Streptosporangiaceae bacterium]|jgi:hypothetical protein|nr:hypothetical protein [Streptosporangiaceae bacterium]
MSGTAPEIWIASSDGLNMVRADALVVVRFDRGRVTAQLHDEAKVTVTLVDGSAGPHPSPDFHRQLIRVLAELTDSTGAHLVRPLSDDRGWRWTTESL